MEVYRFQRFVPTTELLKQWGKEDRDLFISSLLPNDPLAEYLRGAETEDEQYLREREWEDEVWDNPDPN